ncbi:MAG: hypothetical protein WCR36_06230 [Bacteroidaceae bacterium]
MDKKIDLSAFLHDNMEVDSMISTYGGSADDYSGTVHCTTTSNGRDADQRSCDVDT